MKIRNVLILFAFTPGLLAYGEVSFKQDLSARSIFNWLRGGGSNFKIEGKLRRRDDDADTCSNSSASEPFLRFNSIFFGNFTTTGGQDISGPLAVRGNMSTSDYTVNSNHTSNCTDITNNLNGYGLVVGGKYNGGNNKVRGATYLPAGTNTSTIQQLESNCTIVTDKGTGIFNFDQAYTNAIEASKKLAGLSPTLILADDGNLSRISDPVSKFDVVTMDTCKSGCTFHTGQLSDPKRMLYGKGTWDGPRNMSWPSPLVVNIPVTVGSTIEIAGDQPSANISSCSTIYNFYPADDAGNYSPGSIYINRNTVGKLGGLTLAPEADIHESDTGNFAGQLIANNYDWQGSGVEIQDYAAFGGNCTGFEGCLPIANNGGGGFGFAGGFGFDGQSAAPSFDGQLVAPSFDGQLVAPSFDGPLPSFDGPLPSFDDPLVAAPLVSAPSFAAEPSVAAAPPLDVAPVFADNFAIIPPVASSSGDLATIVDPIPSSSGDLTTIVDPIPSSSRGLSAIVDHVYISPENLKVISGPISGSPQNLDPVIGPDPPKIRIIVSSDSSIIYTDRIASVTAPITILSSSATYEAVVNVPSGAPPGALLIIDESISTPVIRVATSSSESQSSSMSVTSTGSVVTTVIPSSVVSSTEEELRFCTYGGYPHFHKEGWYDYYDYQEYQGMTEKKNKKNWHHKHNHHDHGDKYKDEDEYEDEDEDHEDDDEDENDDEDEHDDDDEDDDEDDCDDEEHDHGKHYHKEKGNKDNRK